jgi:hypothetical protein
LIHPRAAAVSGAADSRRVSPAVKHPTGVWLKDGSNTLTSRTPQGRQTRGCSVRRAQAAERAGLVLALRSAYDFHLREKSSPRCVAVLAEDGSNSLMSRTPRPAVERLFVVRKKEADSRPSAPEARTRRAEVVMNGELDVPSSMRCSAPALASKVRRDTSCTRRRWSKERTNTLMSRSAQGRPQAARRALASGARRAWRLAAMNGQIDASLPPWWKAPWVSRRASDGAAAAR